MRYAVRLISAALATTLAAAPALAAGGEVNVYSYRQPFLIQPLFEAFTADTGIKVNVVYAPQGLLKRLQAEGARSPADLVMTVDISRLQEVVDAGLAQPVKTETLTKTVPAEFRQPDGLWYALTLRARLIYASRARVKPGGITSYEDLADPKWKGRVCTRKGDHDYQVALLASMIAHHGEAKAKQWLAGLKANLARKPQGNDRAQVKAIMEGVCDVALGNNYYMGHMLADPKQRAWAESAYVVFPNQKDRGVHMNISGVLLTKSAPNRANAVRLMEFLVGDEAQEIYAKANYEYPVKVGVAWAPLLESWGEFRRDTLSLETIARYRKRALELVNEVGYNS